MSNLYRELDTDRNQGLKMLSALERGGLLSLLGDRPIKLSQGHREQLLAVDGMETGTRNRIPLWMFGLLY